MGVEKTNRAIPIYVYRKTGRDFDCTNGGISSKFEQLLCLCDDGYIDIDPDNPPENLVKPVHIGLPYSGISSYHLEPVARPDPGNVGWMMGGNYAASSDSRFADLFDGIYGAVAVHDRQETRELYEALSR